MNLLYSEGQKGAYPASYYAASANQTLDLGPMEGDSVCDVAIVGAGFTGLSAAYHLAELGYSVMVLEAQRVGWGASGRNGGQLGTGQRVDQMTLEKMLGDDHAMRLWELAEASKDLVKNLVHTHKIECDLKPGIIYADHKRRFAAETEAYVRHLNKRYGYDQIGYVDSVDLHEYIGTNAYHGGSLDWGAAHLHPLNFALGLAEAALHEGAQIFEQTEVTKITHGARVNLETNRGRVRAEHVLLACNGYLGELEGHVGAKVMPINSYIVATEPLSEALARDVIRDDVAVADSRFVVNYYRLSEDRRMLFGGRESYGYRYPDDIAASVKKRMVGIYPQLADARIDYYWGGTLGITMNRMPHVARLAPNILSASGYSGHGLGMSTLCGQLMAEAIHGNASRFDTMASVPVPQFPGGMMLRRPLMVLAMLYFAMRDRF